MSLTKIIPDIKNNFTKIIVEMVNSNDFTGLDAVPTVLEWYKEAGTEKPDFLNLTNKIANVVIDNVLEPIIEPVLGDIELQIRNKEIGTKFSTKPFTAELKPYVEFVKKINNADVAIIKIKFQLNANIQINDIEVKHTNKNTLVNFGNLEGLMNMSIISIVTPIAKYEEPILLGEKSFSFELPSVNF